MNNLVFNNLSYGVYVVTTWDGERPTGCTANSIMQITAEPATIAVSIHHDNYTHELLSKDGRFAVSIISETSNPQIIGRFGFISGKSVDKFDRFSYSVKGGMPVLDDCCGYIVCKVIDKVETSTHTVFIADVEDGDVMEGTPMTYAYYHKVIKGKSPAKAPTYISDKK